MITSIPLLFSVLWVPILSRIKFSSMFFLFGIYYGFLTTLPIGPSQLVSIRAFLLEGNFSGIAAVSGLITGQFLIFLSIYYSPLYVILIKPHLLTLLVLPYILFYWYKIKDLIDYQSLKPIVSIKDIRIYKIFFDTLLFQLFNPVVLPNPVLARLLNIFLFRYSNNLAFLLSSFLGWCFGQFLFINLSKFFLFRIESDSPILYLLVKRIIYRTFSIIILSFSLLQLGKVPVLFITKKFHDNLQFNLFKPEESFILTKFWPTIFFDYRRWNRPFRYIENSRFSNQSPIKKKVSQYFFNMSLSDGKPRLSFTYLPSLYYFEKNLQKSSINLNLFSSNEIYENWINNNEKKKLKIYKELQNRFKLLDNGFFVGEIIEKKKILSTEGNIFTKICDPLLIQQCDKTMIISKSPWFLTEKSYKLTKTQKTFYLSKKDNKLKKWISNQCQELEKKNLILPWEPLSQDAKRILSLLINKSKKRKIDRNLKQINFFDENITSLLNKQNISSIENTRKKINRKSNLNWELILNLSPRQKILFFNNLQKDKWNTIKNSCKNLLLGDFTQLKNIIFFFKTIIKFNKNFQFNKINKEIPRWISKLKNDKFDVIAIGVTDIRQRKVKNLGYLIKGKDKRRKIIRRFSQQSDFRRKLIKGSMRARRRKTLIWKIFQLKTNSPFFLRIIEKPTLFKDSFNVKNIFKIRPSLQNILEKKQKESVNKKSLFIKRTKADRFAIANRWDFPLAQWGRSWLLLIQSHLRKYVILPILIIFKNVIRLLLFQNPEWIQDWYEWNKEIHIRCTYDGTEVSEKELPEQWLRDGLQIKIIYPFYLKPWHNTQNTSNLTNIKKLNFISDEINFFKNLEKKNIYPNQLVKKKKLNYSYLTAWGFQTNLPFGNIKKQPSFWKPIKKKLKKNIFSKFYQIFKNISKKKNLYKISPVDNFQKFDIQQNGYINTNLINLDFHKENVETTKLNNKLLKKNINNDNFFYSEYKTLIYINNLENLIKKKYIYIDNILNKKKILKFNKILIKIKQKSIKIYKKNIQLIQKLPQFFYIKIKKINIILKINRKKLINVINQFFE